jgi:hypothetical protein
MDPAFGSHHEATTQAHARVGRFLRTTKLVCPTMTADCRAKTRPVHLAFYETIAGVIPVLFLALAVEERLKPPEGQNKWDYLLPILIGGLLVMAETAALVAIYTGKSNVWTAWLAANATGLAALVMISTAAIGVLKDMPENLDTPRLRAAVFGWILLVVAVGAVLIVTR